MRSILLRACLLPAFTLTLPAVHAQLIPQLPAKDASRELNANLQVKNLLADHRQFITANRLSFNVGITSVLNLPERRVTGEIPVRRPRSCASRGSS